MEDVQFPLHIRETAPLALALVGLGSDLRAQEFGQGCPGAGGVVPLLESPTPALTAAGWQVRVAGAPAVEGRLLVGVSNSVGLGLPLPLALESIVPGLAGCSLHVSPDLLIPFTTDGNGESILGFDASGLPSGSTLFLQAWQFDFDLTVAPFQLGGWSPGLQVDFIAPSGVTPGDVVVTEFIKDPSFGSDSNAEWIELLNLSTIDLDLRGWILSDDDFDSTVLQSDEPIWLPAGQRIVLANADNPMALGLTNADFVYAQDNGQFNLGNGADEIVLTTFDGIEVDRVVYDAGVLWPDPTGASLELAAGAEDAFSNDDPASWHVSTCYLGGAPFNTDRGTPGGGPGACSTPTLPPGTGELLLSELMVNPSAVSDSLGEYVELYNPGAVDVDLSGWTFCTVSVCEVFDGPLVVPAGERLVLAASGDPNLNGGLPAGAVEWTGNQFLSNSGGSVQLVDSAGQVVTLLPYGADLGFVPASGVAFELAPGVLVPASAVDPANWCFATQIYGSGDLGTPGAANSGCP